jgi:hypothetical protein
MTFHEVISAYRDYRKVQEQAKEGSNASSVALTAALNGQSTNQSINSSNNTTQNKMGPSRCVCGHSKHHWRDCFHVNPAKRPADWQVSDNIRIKIDENIKKLSDAEQEEISDLVRGSAKTAQWAIMKEEESIVF